MPNKTVPTARDRAEAELGPSILDSLPPVTISVSTPAVKTVVTAPVEESSFASDPAEDQVSDIADATSPDDLARSIEIEIKGKTVEVFYDLSEMTPRLRKRLSALEEGDGAEDALVDYLSTIVTDWTLTNRKGLVTLDDIDSVSYKVLGQIAEAINRDLLPNA